VTIRSPSSLPAIRLEHPSNHTPRFFPQDTITPKQRASDRLPLLPTRPLLYPFCVFVQCICISSAPPAFSFVLLYLYSYTLFLIWLLACNFAVQGASLPGSFFFRLLLPPTSRSPCQRSGPTLGFRHSRAAMVITPKHHAFYLPSSASVLFFIPFDDSCLGRGTPRYHNLSFHPSSWGLHTHVFTAPALP